MNSRRNSGMVKMAVIALLLALTYSSEAFALKYVIPFPNNKREASNAPERPSGWILKSKVLGRRRVALVVGPLTQSTLSTLIGKAL